MALNIHVGDAVTAFHLPAFVSWNSQPSIPKEMTGTQRMWNPGFSHCRPYHQRWAKVWTPEAGNFSEIHHFHSLPYLDSSSSSDSAHPPRFKKQNEHPVKSADRQAAMLLSQDSVTAVHDIFPGAEIDKLPMEHCSLSWDTQHVSILLAKC